MRLVRLWPWFVASVIFGASTYSATAGIVVKRLAVSPEYPTGWVSTTTSEVTIDQTAKTIEFLNTRNNSQYWIWAGTDWGLNFVPSDIDVIDSSGTLDGDTFSIIIVAPNTSTSQYIGLAGARHIGVTSSGGIHLGLTNAYISGLSKISGDCRVLKRGRS